MSWCVPGPVCMVAAREGVYAQALAARVLATGGYCAVGADGTLQKDRRGQEDRGQGEEEEGGRQRERRWCTPVLICVWVVYRVPYTRCMSACGSRDDVWALRVPP